MMIFEGYEYVTRYVPYTQHTHNTYYKLSCHIPWIPPPIHRLTSGSHSYRLAVISPLMSPVSTHSHHKQFSLGAFCQRSYRTKPVTVLCEIHLFTCHIPDLAHWLYSFCYCVRNCHDTQGYVHSLSRSFLVSLHDGLTVICVTWLWQHVIVRTVSAYHFGMFHYKMQLWHGLIYGRWILQLTGKC